MTLDAGEFIRRFLLHVLPTASFASATTAAPACSSPRRRAHPHLLQRQDLAGSRAVMAAARPIRLRPYALSLCGSHMIVVETFEGPRPAQPPSGSRIRIDTS